MTVSPPPIGSLSSARWALAQFTARQRRTYYLNTALQMLAGLLDLLAVLLIGLTALIAAGLVQDQQNPPSILASLAHAFPALADPRSALLIAGATAAALMLAKSALWAVLTRRLFTFLSSRQTELSIALLSRWMNQSLEFHERMSPSSLAVALTTGASAAITGVLGSWSLIVVDASVLVILGIGLLMFNPIVTVLAGAYFALVALLLHRFLASWGSASGRVVARSTAKAMEAISEGQHAYRELWALQRVGPFVAESQSAFAAAAEARADIQFQVVLPKLAYESALVIGAVMLTVGLFYTSGIDLAVTTLAVFLAAASRLMPSLLRLNGQLVNLRSSSGQAVQTSQLLAMLSSGTRDEGRGTSLPPSEDRHAGEGPPTVSIDDVTFAYPRSDVPAVNQLTVQFDAGHLSAITGPSGSGKSTLVDLILGLQVPATGSVKIAGYSPRGFLAAWPGSVAYVPQDVFILSATVRTNVAFSAAIAPVDDAAIWAALAQVGMAERFRQESTGLDTLLGGSGPALSGGERQRIGLARALLSRPRLIVLDEPTSALDPESESLVLDVLLSLKGQSTIVVIAHRPGIIPLADRVLRLQNGRQI